MKQDTTPRKLRLHKETVRELTEDGLSRAVGGNGDSGGIICLYSLVLCGDSIICSILAGSCGNNNGG